MRLPSSLETYLKRIVIRVGGRGTAQTETNASCKQRSLEGSLEMSSDTTDKSHS